MFLHENENAISSAVLGFKMLEAGKCGFNSSTMLSEDKRKENNLEVSSYLAQQGKIPLNRIGAGDNTLMLLALANYVNEAKAGKLSSKNNALRFVTELISRSDVDVNLAPSQVSCR